MALLDDLHQIAPLAGGEPLRPPIVEEQEIDFRKSTEQPGEAAIAVLQLEFREETRRTRVEGGIAVATGFMRKGARQPRLADPGWADNEHVATLSDPAAGGKLLEQPFIELALGSVIDVFDAGLAVAQARRAQADLQALGIAVGHLAID